MKALGHIEAWVNGTPDLLLCERLLLTESSKNQAIHSPDDPRVPFPHAIQSLFIKKFALGDCMFLDSYHKPSQAGPFYMNIDSRMAL